MKEYAIGGVVVRQVIEQHGAGFTPSTPTGPACAGGTQGVNGPRVLRRSAGPLYLQHSHLGATPASRTKRRRLFKTVSIFDHLAVTVG